MCYRKHEAGLGDTWQCGRQSCGAYTPSSSSSGLKMSTHAAFFVYKSSPGRPNSAIRIPYASDRSLSDAHIVTARERRELADFGFETAGENLLSAAHVSPEPADVAFQGVRCPNGACSALACKASIATADRTATPRSCDLRELLRPLDPHVHEGLARLIMAASGRKVKCLAFCVELLRRVPLMNQAEGAARQAM
eukprot:4740811-Pleurochrysis_carterae.AAC.1